MSPCLHIIAAHMDIGYGPIWMDHGYGSMSPCLHIIADMDMDMAPCPYIGYGYDSMDVDMEQCVHIITHMVVDIIPCLHICHFTFIIRY